MKKKMGIGIGEMGWKTNVRSRKMKVWIIRGTTMVLLWTCLVQLTALGDTWGPRVLKGWPSSSVVQDAKLLTAHPANVLPPKSESSLHICTSSCYVC